MKLNRKYIVSGIVIAALVAGVTVSNSVQAQESSSMHQNLIQTLVQRFGLNEAEVQEVFEAHKAERMAEKEALMTQRLDEAVANGTITEEQKQLLLTKHEEMKAEKEALQDLSPEERREAMQQHRAEMEAWAEENGIDLSELGKWGGRGHRHGLERGFGEGVRES